MDIEAPIRREVCAALGDDCERMEEAEILLPRSDIPCRIDVLLRPKVATLHDVTLAIEVKKLDLLTDSDLGPWIKQAFDYVGYPPMNGWPRVVGAFVWIREIPVKLGESDRVAGMLQLAQHFRVGKAVDHKRGIVALKFGPSCEIWKQGVGWHESSRARLLAKRTYAGTRKGFPDSPPGSMA